MDAKEKIGCTIKVRKNIKYPTGNKKFVKYFLPFLGEFKVKKSEKVPFPQREGVFGGLLPGKMTDDPIPD